MPQLRTISGLHRATGRVYTAVPNSDRFAEVVDTFVGNEITIKGAKYRPVDPLRARSTDIDSAILPTT